MANLTHRPYSAYDLFEILYKGHKIPELELLDQLFNTNMPSNHMVYDHLLYQCLRDAKLVPPIELVVMEFDVRWPLCLLGVMDYSPELLPGVAFGELLGPV